MIANENALVERLRKQRQCQRFDNSKTTHRLEDVAYAVNASAKNDSVGDSQVRWNMTCMIEGDEKYGDDVSPNQYSNETLVPDLIQNNLSTTMMMNA